MSQANEPINFYQLRDLGRTISVATLLIRRHYGHMFRTIGLICLPLFLAMSTFYFLATSQMIEAVRRQPSFEPVSRFSTDYLYFILLAFILVIAMYWSCTYYMMLYEEKGPESFEMNDIWAKVQEHGWGLIFTLLLYIILITLLFLAVSLVTGVLMMAPFLVFLVWIPALVGMMFLYTLLQTTICVYLIEKKSAIQAITRALFLLKNNWWKSVGVLFCSYVVVIAIAFVPNVLFQLLGLVPGLNFSVAGSKWFMLLFQNLFMVLTFLGTFLMILSFNSLYYSLREEKDLVSLARRVENIGNPVV